MGSHIWRVQSRPGGHQLTYFLTISPYFVVLSCEALRFRTFMRAYANSFVLQQKGGRKMRTKKSNCVMWAAALMSAGFFAGEARATFYSEQYEMKFSPDTVAGTVNGFTLNVAAGTGTYGPSGSTFAGGIMTFLDDYNSSSDQG